ncbi:MAG: hypothetical protein QG628_663 [Patescibacteria group bacterium]|nr:hypothetical protein [Patescibacteria group bacterium]
MNLFRLRYGNTEAAWDAWKNEQVDMTEPDTIKQIGGTAVRLDPLPYCSQQEYITNPVPHETIDLLSQGI